MSLFQDLFTDYIGEKMFRFFRKIYDRIYGEIQYRKNLKRMKDKDPFLYD